MLIFESYAGESKLSGGLTSGSDELAGDQLHEQPSRVRALIQAFPRYRIWIVAVLVLIGVGSEVWQPFALGFEHDDWYLFVRPNATRDFTNYNVDRPGYHWLSWIILHVWDGSAFEFQSIKVLINLATAASICWITFSTQRLFRSPNPVLAVAAGTLWLIAPWGLGYTVWASAAFTNVALLCFCISMVQFLQWVERGSGSGLVISVLLWAISVETYQSTWFAFVPMALAILLATYDRRTERNRTLMLGAILLAIQLGSLLHTMLTTPKSQNAGMIGLFVKNVQDIVRIHIHHLGWPIFLLVLAVVFAFARAAWRDAGPDRLDLRRILAGLALAILGSCGSAAIYAAAGYFFGEAGETSKTSVMLTFWTAMGFSLALSVNIEERSKAIVGVATSLSVIFVCLIGYPAKARPWVAAWKLEREVLDTIKGQSFPRRLEAGDVIISDLPTNISGVPVFGAPWSITPAALLTWADVIPDLALQSGSAVQIVPAADFNFVWEPGKLTISPNSTIPAKRLWLWRWRTGDAVLVKSYGPLPPHPLGELFDELQRSPS